MKNHKKYEELIQGYLDNALSNQEKKDLKDHLKSCRICEEKLKERQNLLERLRSKKEEITCPDYLIDNILKNTTQKEAPTIIRPTIIRWKYFAVSAAALLIVFSTILFNLENNEQLLTPIEIKEPREKEVLAEVELSKSKEISLDKKEIDVSKSDKPTVALPQGVDKAPKASLSEKKVVLGAAERTREAPLSEDIQDLAAAEESQEKMPVFSKAAKVPPSTEIKKDQLKEIPAFKVEKDIKIESASPKVLEYSILGGGISISTSEETRFVFPEEGSVVGEAFEIVLILENPTEIIEISLDGEKITNYTKEKDSNVIYIGSDSIPPLEEGLHYLSLVTSEEKSITFYKEG